MKSPLPASGTTKVIVTMTNGNGGALVLISPEAHTCIHNQLL
jgi:hypothetical protein